MAIQNRASLIKSGVADNDASRMCVDINRQPIIIIIIMTLFYEEYTVGKSNLP